MLAKLVMPGPDPGGIILTIVIGIIGALIGGFVVNDLLEGPGVTGINLPSILVATYRLHYPPGYILADHTPSGVSSQAFLPDVGSRGKPSEKGAREHE
jgi:hypothetical protein